MLFWIMAIVLAAAVALGLVAAIRGASGADADAEGLSIYRDQLAEVERDLARGVVTEEEAGRLKTEIARRLLRADRAAQGAGGAGRGGAAAPVAATLAALALAFGGYWWLGAPGYPDLPMADRLVRAEAMLAARPAQADYIATLAPVSEAMPEDPESAALLTRLREVVAARPEDRQGLTFLVEEELALGNIRRAADAQAGLVAAMGAEAGAADRAKLAWLMVSAAEGYVSPEAGAAAEAALALDPENGLARFILGEMYQQNLRPDLGFRLWRDLLEDSPEDAPWVPIIRERIGLLAGAAGVEYTAPPAATGPSAADAEAMAEMSPEDRDAAIRGMVEGLAARLANEGGPAADWAQLVRALGVLGETERAAAIWAEAQDVFAASPSELEAVATAAREAGVLQ